MLRGEIRLIDLEPARGNEANKRRPAVIVSNDRANVAADRLGRRDHVVPVTSNVARVFPFQTLLSSRSTGLRIDSKCSVDYVRIGAVLGRAPSEVMAELDEALRLHLAL